MGCVCVVVTTLATGIGPVLLVPLECRRVRCGLMEASSFLISCLRSSGRLLYASSSLINMLGSAMICCKVISCRQNQGIVGSGQQGSGLVCIKGEWLGVIKGVA